MHLCWMCSQMQEVCLHQQVKLMQRAHSKNMHFSFHILHKNRLVLSSSESVKRRIYMNMCKNKLPYNHPTWFNHLTSLRTQMVSCQYATPFLASSWLFAAGKGQLWVCNITIISTFLLDISIYVKQVFNNLYLQILRWNNRGSDLH